MQIKGIVEKIVEKVIRIRNDKEVKKARISLSYYGKMEIKRNQDLTYKIKFKIARRQRHNIFLK
jgi:hypothetical protein